MQKLSIWTSRKFVVLERVKAFAEDNVNFSKNFFRRFLSFRAVESWECVVNLEELKNEMAFPCSQEKIQY